MLSVKIQKKSSIFKGNLRYSAKLTPFEPSLQKIILVWDQKGIREGTVPLYGGGIMDIRRNWFVFAHCIANQTAFSNRRHLFNDFFL